MPLRPTGCGLGTDFAATTTWPADQPILPYQPARSRIRIRKHLNDVRRASTRARATQPTSIQKHQTTVNPHIQKFLENDSEQLLDHRCEAIPKERLTLPEPRFVDRSFLHSDRSNRVLANLERLYRHGRLGGSGYMSILPVDQGIEHSAGASFAPNPDYFDPRNIVSLAIEGGCNAVASTAGVLGYCAREFAHHIPFILKLNHNELLSYPNDYDQIFFTDVDFRQAVRTAVINKRADGCGLISGRKVFQRPRKEGIELLHAIQDVYLEDSITVA